MRRPSKDPSPKLSADSQRLATFAKAIVQAASRLEERGWVHSLDAQLQKSLKHNHQESIDNALNRLFTTDLNAYDALMESVEAMSESCSIEQEQAGVTVKYDALLVAAPILAWTRFAIASGPIPADMVTTLSAHFSAHLLADDVRMAMSPTLYAIDQLPRTHVEAYNLTHRLAQAALKGTTLRPAAKAPETAPFLADTRYLLAVVVAPADVPLFRWQTPQNQNNFIADRAAALVQWQSQATPNITHILPGCAIELLLPEAYYVACREADRLVRPVSVRAAVYYLTQTLAIEADELRAIVAAFGDELIDDQIDEYRIGFTLRQSPDVIYGIVWPLYGPEDEDGAPDEALVHSGIASLAERKKPIDEILALLEESGIRHVKRHNERFPVEYCDDCGAPLFADPSGEMMHAEMPEDTPQGNEHFH
jgi:hypothetical protein